MTAGEVVPSRDGHDACDPCIARTVLLAHLSGLLDTCRAHIAELLVLPDADLVAALVPRRPGPALAELERVRREGGDAERRAAADAGLRVICRCSAEYPRSLRDLDAPPAVLYVGGAPAAWERMLTGGVDQAVAIVGARRCSTYGAEVSRVLGRDLAGAGLHVVSGRAQGIDAAAHVGALDGGGITVAVLATPDPRTFPETSGALAARIGRTGVLVSELGPGAPARRWCFVARNRIIAALAGMTVVVEAGERSGALVTARAAETLGRPVGAVPGRVTTPQAEGANALLAGGHLVVRGAQDVLDGLYGPGASEIGRSDDRPLPTASQRETLDAIAAGADTVAALTGGAGSLDQRIADVAALELVGWLRRGGGGRLTVIP